MIYIMLMISVPFTSMGLVRGFFSSIPTVASEYLNRRNNTPEKAYQFQNPRYFPKLKEEDYQEYLQLTDETQSPSVEDQDKKARKSEILHPLNRFWFGIGTSSEEIARYENSQWGLFDRLKASYMAIPWNIWRSVLWRWSIFFFLAFIGALCLSQIFYNDWVKRENLSFPIAQLPLAMFHSESQINSKKESTETSQKKTQIFSNPFFWSGAGIGIILLPFSGFW